MLNRFLILLIGIGFVGYGKIYAQSNETYTGVIVGYDTLFTVPYDMCPELEGDYDLLVEHHRYILSTNKKKNKELKSLLGKTVTVVLKPIAERVKKKDLDMTCNYYKLIKIISKSKDAK